MIPDDTKPQKNADQRLASFYSVMFTGEVREGKQKRQISLAPRDILNKIVPKALSRQRHLVPARRRGKSVVLWERRI